MEVARSDVHLGCEAGTYADGALFNKALGWGGVRYGSDADTDDRASFVLHGSPVSVTSVVDLDPRRLRVIAAGQFVTYDDWSRNDDATWAILADRLTGVAGLYGASHFEFEPRGPNLPTGVNKGHKYDKIREKQADGFYGQLLAIAAEWAPKLGIRELPIVAAADTNGDADDPYDGPGKAADRHGFADTDEVAKKRTNGDKTTHAKKDWNKGGRIDRIKVWGPVTVLSQTTINTWPFADHALVGVTLTLTNEPL